MAEKMGGECNTYFHSFLSHHASDLVPKYISRIPVISLTIYLYYMEMTNMVENAKVKHPPILEPRESLLIFTIPNSLQPIKWTVYTKHIFQTHISFNTYSSPLLNEVLTIPIGFTIMEKWPLKGIIHHVW